MAGSGTARWVIIGTAIAAAAAATFLLMGPGPDAPRPGEHARSIGSSQATSPAISGEREQEKAAAPPLDQIDADSRAAMRDFLRQSVQEEDPAVSGESGKEGGSDW